MLHPVRHQRATTADDAGDALAHEGHVFAQDTGVNGHVIHALLGLLFDDFEHQLEGEVFGAADAGNGFVHGNGADGNGRCVDDGFANFRDVPASGEIHDGICAVVDGVVELFQFFVNVGAGGGIADVGVDFAFAGDTDGHRLEIAVMEVGGNDHAAAGDFAANELRLELFAFGDVLHLFGDDTLPREVHLRDVEIGR